jgi:uncharacterized membrane protein
MVVMVVVIHLLRCLTTAVKDTDSEGNVIMALVMGMIRFCVAMHYVTQFTLIT